MPTTVVALGPHPDDVEAGCFGTLLKHAAAGDRVIVVVTTRGGYGNRSEELIRSEMERAQAAEYAALWDAEDQQIRASRDAGEADLTVAPLPQFLGEDFVGSNRRDWFNMCVARYYGVRTIASADGGGS